jgi:hypothetical protein
MTQIEIFLFHLEKRSPERSAIEMERTWFLLDWTVFQSARTKLMLNEAAVHSGQTHSVTP